MLTLRRHPRFIVYAVLIISTWITFYILIMSAYTPPYDDQLRRDQINTPQDEKTQTPHPTQLEVQTREPFREFNRRVHVFFYSWYGSPEHDGRWMHWNHEILKHWVPEVAENYPTGQYKPPDDAGSMFFPELGFYSSKDPVVMRKQFQQLRSFNIHVISVSWWGPKTRRSSMDGQGYFSDETIPLILDIAAEEGILVNFHMEPYEGRSVKSVLDDLRYIKDNYHMHPAFYRDPSRDNKTMFYMYDSYIVPANQWKRLLSPDGDLSIRGTDLDADFIGLILERNELNSIEEAGFDGIYNYFASNGFTQASLWGSWKLLSNWAKEKGKLFIPCVGPGYNDEKVRPWNVGNTKSRGDGRYYNEAWKHAIDANPEYIAITSYNEWHEGTQIEPAVPFTSNTGVEFLNYLPHAPDYYLNLTSENIKLFLSKK